MIAAALCDDRTRHDRRGHRPIVSPSLGLRTLRVVSTLGIMPRSNLPPRVNGRELADGSGPDPPVDGPLFDVPPVQIRRNDPSEGTGFYGVDGRELSEAEADEWVARMGGKEPRSPLPGDPPAVTAHLRATGATSAGTPPALSGCGAHSAQRREAMIREGLEILRRGGRADSSAASAAPSSSGNPSPTSSDDEDGVEIVDLDGNPVSEEDLQAFIDSIPKDPIGEWPEFSSEPASRAPSGRDATPVRVASRAPAAPLAFANLRAFEIPAAWMHVIGLELVVFAVGLYRLGDPLPPYGGMAFVFALLWWFPRWLESTIAGAPWPLTGAARVRRAGIGGVRGRSMQSWVHRGVLVSGWLLAAALAALLLWHRPTVGRFQPMRWAAGLAYLDTATGDVYQLMPTGGGSYEVRRVRRAPAPSEPRG